MTNHDNSSAVDVDTDSGGGSAAAGIDIDAKIASAVNEAVGKAMDAFLSRVAQMDVREPDERTDDEGLAETADRADAASWRHNLKALADIHRDDDRWVFRNMTFQLATQAQSLAGQAVELFHARRAQENDQFSERRQRRDEQHSIIWNASQIFRDQSRDNAGAESVVGATQDTRLPQPRLDQPS